MSSSVASPHIFSECSHSNLLERRAGSMSCSVLCNVSSHAVSKSSAGISVCPFMVSDVLPSGCKHFPVICMFFHRRFGLLLRAPSYSDGELGSSIWGSASFLVSPAAVTDADLTQHGLQLGSGTQHTMRFYSTSTTDRTSNSE